MIATWLAGVGLLPKNHITCLFSTGLSWGQPPEFGYLTLHSSHQPDCNDELRLLHVTLSIPAMRPNSNTAAYKCNAVHENSNAGVGIGYSIDGDHLSYLWCARLHSHLLVVNTSRYQKLHAVKTSTALKGAMLHRWIWNSPPDVFSEESTCR